MSINRKLHSGFSELVISSIVAASGLALFRIGAWTSFKTERCLSNPEAALFSFAIQAIFLAVIYAIDRRKPIKRYGLMKLALASAVLGAASLAAYFGTDASDAITVIASMSVNGACSSFIIASWGFLLCSSKPKESVFSLTLAFAIYGIAVWGMAALPPALISVVGVLSWPLSFICLTVAFSKNLAREKEGFVTARNVSANNSIPWALWAVLALCTVASMITKALVPITEDFLSSSYRYYWPAMFIAIFILYAFWTLRNNGDASKHFWIPLVLIIVGGLVCYMAFIHIDAEFADSSLRSSKECLMLLCWILFSTIASRRQSSPIGLFALGSALFLSIPSAISEALGLAPGLDIESSYGTAVIGILLAIACLLTLLSFWVVFKEMRGGNRPQTKPSLSSKSAEGDSAIAMLADLYKLTPREIEVVELLCRGYTFAQIGDALFISLDTVRTHVKNIYGKLGIHKKQDLIVEVEKLRSSIG